MNKRQKSAVKKREKYEVIERRWISELNADACLLRHKKSGARVFTVKNDDDNKVFSIAFRTPPKDSTGVPHIMEHSVLCGSEKFPLKDPFVELAKGSLNTFLNAMTYPDKTVYPIASQNDQDFKNLMDVYMDAVLHPNIGRENKIFLQEGWHYELEDADGELIYNGVVYNEMKGAFSNPESVLERYIMHTLYPDNEYANESGGDPEVIPELSYEAFLDFHRRYYHPSNSYIYLYGDMDMKERLAWLDSAYLSKYDAIQLDSEIHPQKPFAKMRETEISYSIGENEPEEGNTYLSLSTVIQDNLNAKLNMAFEVLEYVLLDAPGAPLKQSLLEAGIGADILGGYEDGILQPYFSVIAKNADREQKDAFLDIIQKTLRKLVQQGLDKKALLAGLNNAEFQYREADFGRTPKGLVYGLTALDAWLYDGMPWTHLCCEPLFAELKAEVETGYFEKLIETYLIDNPFAACVMVVPKRGLTGERDEALRRKLAERKAGMSQEELQAIVAETKALKLFQDTPTPEEDLKKLPLLSRGDIGVKAKGIHYEEAHVGETRILYTPLATNGIAYLRLNFNTACLEEEELPYAGLLKSVLAGMNTEKHGYQDLSSDILLNTGGLSFSLTAYPDLSQYNAYTGIFSAEIKLLYDKLAYGMDIVTEILSQTRFEDEKRMTEILNEAKSRARMKLEGSSHTCAVNRATGYFSGTARFSDLCSGISYYKFLEEAVEQFKTDKKSLPAKLREVAEKLFAVDRLFLSVGCEETGFVQLKALLAQEEASVWKLGRDAASQQGKTSQAAGKAPQLLLSGNQNEGFRTASQVNYVARTGRFDTEKLPYTGALRVLKVILNYEYLWINLRVKGGAYGCMAGFGRSGEGYLVSYRDPNLAETIGCYEALPAYLEQFETSERDMTKYIIGAIAELDMPQTNLARAQLSVSAYLSQVTNEMLQQERDEVLSASVADIRALKQYVEQILESGAACTIGNAAQIDRNQSQFMEIRDLYE